MKQTLLLSFIFCYISADAQVDEVNLTVAPTISYHFYDKKSTVGNGLMVGAQAGFSFGRYLELKALYQQSIGIKQNFDQYENDIRAYYPQFDFNNRDLTVTQAGGEFKGNIPIGNFYPYITLGTGFQTIKREGNFLTENDVSSNITRTEYKVQTLYGTGGIGIKFNMGSRAAINVEGKGFVYNLAPSSLLYDAAGPVSYATWVREQDKQRMLNWSVGAGLQFYFGGKNYNDLSEMDKAYLKKFGSGMKGLKVTMAPGIALFNFDDKTAFKNTYALGATVGLEVTDYVGFRGYYYQAMDNASTFKFDWLSAYGLDFVGKLNGARGIVPFLTVGGGYINVAKDYQGRSTELAADTLLNARSGYFAKGGAGLNIPVSRHIELFGAANVLFTANNDNTQVADIRSISELNTHTMYNFGVRLKLGKKTRTDDYSRVSQPAITADPSKEQLNSRIVELENKLDEAGKTNKNAAKEQENSTIIEINPAKEQAKYNKEKNAAPGKVSLTPAELENMIDKVVKGVDSENTTDLQKRMDRLEFLLLQMKNDNRYPYPAYNSSYNETAGQNVNDRLLQEIKRLNEKIELQNRKIEEIKNK